MSLPPLNKYFQAFFETLLMVSASALIAIGLGLLLAIVLTVTAKSSLYPKPRLHRGLSVTVSVIAMINASAMAGAVGAGGLGDLAIRYGYERYETRVMFEVIVILIALVSVIQLVGERVSRRFDHRH